MHEIGHIAKHLSKNRDVEYIDFYRGKNESIAENEADQYAQLKLISKEIWDEINENQLPLDEDKIISLSNHYKINPAILLGHFCYETNNYAVRIAIDKKLK